MHVLGIFACLSLKQIVEGFKNFLVHSKVYIVVKIANLFLVIFTHYTVRDLMVSILLEVLNVTMTTTAYLPASHAPQILIAIKDKSLRI